jgi:hypothetical protein
VIVGEAGRMLDTAIAKEQRAKFAQGFFGGDRASEGFSFNNTLEARDADAGDLARRVLLQDHRQRSDIADPQRRAAVADVQNDAASQYAKWTDEQLMRLIFANRDGAKAVHATLTLGPVNIRPQPTMQAIYAYEALADACRQETFAVGCSTTCAALSAPAALVQQPAAAKPASNKAAQPQAQTKAFQMSHDPPLSWRAPSHRLELALDAWCTVAAMASASSKCSRGAARHTENALWGGSVALAANGRGRGH